MHIEQLLQMWPLPATWHAEPAWHGSNNRVSVITLSTGDRAVLRLSPDRSLSQIHHENAITCALQNKLPFHIPSLISTADGTLGYSFSQGNIPWVATLWTYISGVHPPRNNPAQAWQAGCGLAQLDSALAAHGADLPINADAPAAYSMLNKCHPAVPDPLEAFAELPILPSQYAALLVVWETVQQALVSIDTPLPQQYIHGDYHPTNVLFTERGLEGVLDFEVSTRDLRVMDLVVALSWWPVWYTDAAGWKIFELFGSGYASNISLTSAEREVLPFLFQLRGLSSLIHRIGRFRQGLESPETIQERVAQTIRYHEWIAQHTAQILAIARKWLCACE